jgi:hypothetical protein
MENNPYAAPTALPLEQAPGMFGNAEAIRREHIGHEASVKSIGTLYFLGGIGLVIVAAFAGFTPDFPTSREGTMATVVTVAIILAIAALQFWLGTGLRRLNRVARGVSAVFAGIGLLGFPLGTIINGYILYLLVSRKGNMVFSPEYKEVIAQTPHVKYKTSIIVWIILGIFVLVIVGGAAVLIFSGTRR